MAGCLYYTRSWSFCLHPDCLENIGSPSSFSRFEEGPRIHLSNKFLGDLYAWRLPFGEHTDVNIQRDGLHRSCLDTRMFLWLIDRQGPFMDGPVLRPVVLHLHLISRLLGFNLMSCPFWNLTNAMTFGVLVQMMGKRADAISSYSYWGVGRSTGVCYMGFIQVELQVQVEVC